MAQHKRVVRVRIDDASPEGWRRLAAVQAELAPLRVPTRAGRDFVEVDLPPRLLANERVRIAIAGGVVMGGAPGALAVANVRVGDRISRDLIAGGAE